MIHPGPWRLVTRTTELRFAGDIVDANGEIVSYTPDICSADDKRLILAAPELLEALKACVRFVPNTGGSGVFGEARDAYLSACALIARIEGGKEPRP
jgi:hypothetical protein